MMSKFLVVVAFSSALMAADRFTGFLVDAGCYDTEERNVRVYDFETNHDRDYEIRVCAPSAKSKEYKIVDHDGQSLKLDPAANSKVVQALGANRLKKPVAVTIEGTRTGKSIQVDSISLR